MTVKTAAIFVCENCIVDKRNVVSAIGIFGGMSIEKLPFKIPFWVYAYIRGWVGSHRVKVSYKDPDEQEFILDEILIDFNNPKFAQTYVSRLEKEFNLLGEYTFCLYLDDECVSEYYVDFFQADKE